MKLSKQVLPQVCNGVRNDSALADNSRILYTTVFSSLLCTEYVLNSYGMEIQEYLRRVTDSNLWYFQLSALTKISSQGRPNCQKVWENWQNY